MQSAEAPVAWAPGHTGAAAAYNLTTTKPKVFMKSIARSAALLIATGMLTFSCRQELDTQKVQPAEAGQALTVAQLDDQRTQFAKTLAKALANEEVRSFIKLEAGKQFDLDYDVLFRLVKDKELSGGRSFSATLAGFAESEAQFARTTASLPLLTIFVPELKGFSAKNWDVANQIPMVAVVNSGHDEQKATKIIAFDQEGNQHELDSKEEPNVPVIVVKENERLVAKGAHNNGRVGAEPRGRLLHNDGKTSFYFTDDAFDKRQVEQKANARFYRYSTFDPAVRYAYENKAVNHRDYVYYGILSNTDKGPIKAPYSEFLTGIMVNNISSYNYFDDWTDGYYEFTVRVLYFSGQLAATPLPKGFSCAKTDLFNFDSNGNPTSTRQYQMSIELSPFDLYKYGDTWRFQVFEDDPVSSTTVQYTVTGSSTYGGKFELGGGDPVKVGIGFNGSTTTTVTGTYTYTVNDASDDLKEATLAYGDAILLSTSQVGLEKWGRSREINTGYVLLSVEPKARW